MQNSIMKLILWGREDKSISKIFIKNSRIIVVELSFKGERGLTFALNCLN